MNTKITIPVYTPGILDYTQPESYHRLGAILMALASYLLSFSQVGSKILSQDKISVSQLILIKSSVLTIIVSITSLFYKVPHGILGPPEARKLLIARAVLGYFGLMTLLKSIYLLRLGDAVTLSFTTPIFMIILAAIFLDEIITTYDIVAILFGISGVIFIAQPEIIFGSMPTNLMDNSNSLGYISAGFSAVSNGLANVLVRKLDKNVHIIHIIFYYTLIPIVPSAFWCYFMEFDLLVWPSSCYSWSWLCIFVVSAFLSQILSYKSLLIAPVGVVAPLFFLQVVFAFVNDFVVFHLSPPAWSLAGAVLVSISVIVSAK